VFQGANSLSVAVVYLARGADGWWRSAAETFLASYRNHDSGFPHVPYVILKGFPDSASLSEAQALFEEQGFEIIHLPDDGFDIGAYVAAARLMREDYACFFNTYSEILGHWWLAKFMSHLSTADIGLVGATGSYESLRPLSRRFPKFPNVHAASPKRSVFPTSTKRIALKAAAKVSRGSFWSAISA
jgi:hypothetical protein